MEPIKVDQIKRIFDHYGLTLTEIEQGNIKTILAGTKLADFEQINLLEEFCKDTIKGILHTTLTENDKAK